ncbi:Tma16p Ecym_2377 [Eremothecium cymbalariae DBVPG|uniref:Translation machinery-associated protein 16 n=1 Tax=Eremothecium cymbalariae (strain CBS 270.75 / DBVPG 7215 / KCTC 17166 / NRRL Y-17582) TaxID=931890 RepID=G8JNP2_ERECY|nr:Hypothetical protein Ecym_2377 [Eremothecium cymbalariae DBVPG\
MPVTKSLPKLQKNMKGKKQTVHPRGRKFKQLVKATLREEKVQNKKRSYNQKKSSELTRIKFVQDIINTDDMKNVETFDNKMTLVIIDEFINRDDHELNELISKRRANRPPTNRQQMLENKKNVELEEFKTGFLCPDLTDAKNVSFLRNWNGTFGALSTLKLIRLNNKGEKVVGGNNPKGQSDDVKME